MHFRRCWALCYLLHCDCGSSLLCPSSLKPIPQSLHNHNPPCLSLPIFRSIVIKEGGRYPLIESEVDSTSSLCQRTLMLGQPMI
ncbi:hypothetical protein IC582_004368 [Cucumis melo]